MQDTIWIGSAIVDDILDTAHPPVARFRLFSNGIAGNHMLPASEELVGSQACTSCGNCLDACPVVTAKGIDTTIGRTSMALENIVADECRRCYRCVYACPQVDSPMKDYVRGFRRAERASHWLAAVSVVTLALTGITIFHYQDSLSTEYYYALGIAHRIFAFGLIVALALYVLLDRRHFRRTSRKITAWSRNDWCWLRGVVKWAASLSKEGRLQRGDLNTGQKGWYLFLLVAVPVFAISGAMQWVGPDLLTKGISDGATLVHTNLAIVFDVLVLLHISLKLMLPNVMDVARGLTHSVKVRRGRAKSFKVVQRQAEPFV